VAGRRGLPDASRVKILSVEDHELFRDGLRVALAALPGPPELREVRTGAEALALLEGDPEVGLVLIDLVLPDMDGLALLRAVRSGHPTVAAAVVSGSERPADARAALDAGACGYIPKSAGRGVLLSALQLIAAGGVYVPPLLLDGDAREPSPLSPRQREVAELLVKGLTNGEIARVLGIGAGTAKTHVAAILQALEVSNRTEAVLALVERGLVEAPASRRA
jgi:DNA-binding NarL/FixJ family response regulator